MFNYLLGLFTPIGIIVIFLIIAGISHWFVQKNENKKNRN